MARLQCDKQRQEVLTEIFLSLHQVSTWLNFPAFPVAECPAANDNVVTFESVCYEFMEHVATWEDAKKICIRQGWSVFKRTEHTEEPLVDYLQSQLLEKEWEKSVWAGKGALGDIVIFVTVSKTFNSQRNI